MPASIRLLLTTVKPRLSTFAAKSAALQRLKVLKPKSEMRRIQGLNALPSHWTNVGA